MRCGHCLSVYYCCAEHQKVDYNRPNGHKISCKIHKQYLAWLVQNEEALRERVGVAVTMNVVTAVPDGFIVSDQNYDNLSKNGKTYFWYRILRPFDTGNIENDVMANPTAAMVCLGLLNPDNFKECSIPDYVLHFYSLPPNEWLRRK